MNVWRGTDGCVLAGAAPPECFISIMTVFPGRTPFDFTLAERDGLRLRWIDDVDPAPRREQSAPPAAQGIFFIGDEENSSDLQTGSAVVLTHQPGAEAGAAAAPRRRRLLCCQASCATAPLQELAYLRPAVTPRVPTRREAARLRKRTLSTGAYSDNVHFSVLRCHGMRASRLHHRGCAFSLNAAGLGFRA